ncbi:hypothetical protein CUS60_09990 [Enterococcus faecium]|uniref:hypothetical protein n=1 Tax=Enterococcus faecium TaxID=1352 RepID=UPI000CF1F4EA|nr:hypothetical protein [Enterococcus faecium]PQF97999.1 hypothetical protein CUS60_09990 [Enterococcus faecium]PQH05922.1 hypothetical protein CUS45_03405 [Enterococcus faecium]
MSKFKEKVLSEISFAMVDDAPDLQKLYDKVAATDEHSELNENQKIVFEWLKWSVKDQRHSTIDAVFLLKSGEALDSVLLALMELNDPQQAEVLAAFAQWGLEQEEA